VVPRPAHVTRPKDWALYAQSPTSSVFFTDFWQLHWGSNQLRRYEMGTQYKVHVFNWTD